MIVQVQTEDFDVGLMLNQLRLAHPNAGAMVSFVGQVRDINNGDVINTLTLEHYPGMTQSALTAIQIEASKRWDMIDSLIIHRVGTLKPLDQIVLVAVLSAHRGDAFKACEFMMDYLKTQAPFWKKEMNATSAHWLDAKTSDDVAAARWQNIGKTQKKISQ